MESSLKKLMTGDCHQDNIFQQIDPTQYVEIDFEAEVVKALTCLYPDYLCGVFAGAFMFEGERRIADLALIHKSLSHWFVIEVELAGHSFEHHVLPQARCFRYGDPEYSCVTSLVRGFESLSRHQAEQLLDYVPRYVAIVGNLPDLSWTRALRVLDVQYLTVSIYRDRNGRSAHEVDGRLIARDENLGFARYSATDNCLRIPKGCGLMTGNIQIVDQFGSLASWTIRENAGVLWISKDRGPALIEHESYVQIIRSLEGRISIRPALA
jgi:hypothetical protein